MPKIKSNEKLYEHICHKYPDVEHIQGEDLNIENMKARHIRRMWPDKNNYKHISHIAVAVGLSDRTVYRIAKGIKLKSRKSF